MMDLPKETRDLRQRVRSFVQEELLPLERDVLRKELLVSSREEPFQAEPGTSYLSDPLGEVDPETYKGLLANARERG